MSAGRQGDAPSVGLADTLHQAGFPMARLKTGTPPRLDARSIDYSTLEVQPSEEQPVPFSALHDFPLPVPHRIVCHSTHTNGFDCDVFSSTDCHFLQTIGR